MSNNENWIDSGNFKAYRESYFTAKFLYLIDSKPFNHILCEDECDFLCTISVGVT